MKGSSRLLNAALWRIDSAMNFVPPFTIIVPTIYGQMLVNRHDIIQTDFLVKTGVAVDHGEIDLLAKILEQLGTGLTFLDVGANFGTYTLALARAVGPGGTVHAFEAQRIIFQMLTGSVALNSLTNVICHHAALGDEVGRIEIPQFDYHQPLNFGSIEFGPEQQEPLDQVRAHDPQRLEFVTLTTIDQCGFAQVHMIKIDVEGMEMAVLKGAEQTIGRCRPVLYVEFLKSDRQALREWLETRDYDVHENKINLLGIPKELKEQLPIVRADGVPAT
jgi:FkbM family methyltransferase